MRSVMTLRCTLRRPRVRRSGSSSWRIRSWTSVISVSAAVSPPVPDQGGANNDLAGAVLNVDDVAKQVVRAIDQRQLYILPHAESRAFIRRRFERIDRAFDA